MIVDKKIIKYNLIIFNVLSIVGLIVLLGLTFSKIIGIQWVYSSLLTVVFSNISLVIGLILPNLLYKSATKLKTTQFKTARFGFFIFGVITLSSRLFWYAVPIVIIGFVNNWQFQGEVFNVIPAIAWPLSMIAVHIVVNYWLLNKEIKERNKLKELNNNVATGDSLQAAF
ncbi:MG406 family protein [Mycoplasma tullyi]|uniref:MG406 family protein n=1 Tax=Mycoplasma tullyi TaxID=1612150 RepID=A0A7D7U7P5_9MOLU|nr:MG406 family protein [Mycoplasma tullyi]QMT98768.1 MG406 family protein [Mycoplasma tullyi]